MLGHFFGWLDRHPGFYWIAALAGTLLLTGWTAFGLRATFRDQSRRGADWVFAGLLLVFLFAWRWPFLLCASEYNPDESQFIAGAMALKHDPVFWRAVDGATAGPLDFYALLPLHALGVPLDYFSIRLTGLLLTWLALCFTQRLFRSFLPPFATQLAVLPTAFFLACVTDVDFVHYASELVPMALMALALYWAGRRPHAAIFAAGCLPWAKLQAGPFVVALLVWQLVQAARTQGSLGRRGATLIVSGLAPTFLALAGLAATGQLEHFFRRYVLQNVVYVGQGQPLRSVLHEFLRRAEDDGQVVLWTATTILLLAASLMVYLRRRQWPSAHFWLGAIPLSTAMLCILVPARTTLHYGLFLVVPALLCIGAAWGDFWADIRLRRGFAFLLVVATLLPLGLRLRQPAPAMFGEFAEHWERPRTELGSVLRLWRQPGARLALWGWRSSLYVESGLPQATRDTVSGWCIMDSPQRAYYRATFLAEMERRRPEVFVDAVGRDATAFPQRSTQGHEIFPALAEFVRRNYRLVTDLEGPRVYVRDDFLESHPLTKSELERRLARGRRRRGEPVAPVIAARVESRVGGRLVHMIEPPAALTWSLDGTERSLRLTFGFHPKAYTEGRTDGAEVIVELRAPGRPALPVYRRLLDPQRQAADRGLQSARVVLPAFPAGTSVAVRTTPGPDGDGAWDWVYYGKMDFVRTPDYVPQQFPGFRRLPDRVDASYPHIVDHEAERRLMLPPPTTLTFVLAGPERLLRFTYGLTEGAYQNGGMTDGVTYRVELQREGAVPRPLFRRQLDPVPYTGDRGPQSAGVILPDDIRPGDRLVLSLDAGAGDSWDWSYIDSLELR